MTILSSRYAKESQGKAAVTKKPPLDLVCCSRGLFHCDYCTWCSTHVQASNEWSLYRG